MNVLLTLCYSAPMYALNSFIEQWTKFRIWGNILLDKRKSSIFSCDYYLKNIELQIISYTKSLQSYDIIENVIDEREGN